LGFGDGFRKIGEKHDYGKIDLMKLTAVFEPAKEGGYTCFVEEIPAAISQGETLAEAKANLLDALKLVLQCQRELVEKSLSPEAVRESIEFPDS
jgi:predicted RNase H-like HicB family nuclease